MVNDLKLSPLLHTGGSPTPQDLADLRTAGVAAVINLALPTSPDALPTEAALVTGLGMVYYPIPVHWENPTRQNLDDFFATMDACRDRAVLVHCVKNMRVSAFIYLYRILRLGWSETEAEPDLLKIWKPSGIWQDFITVMLSPHP